MGFCDGITGHSPLTTIEGSIDAAPQQLNQQKPPPPQIRPSAPPRDRHLCKTPSARPGATPARLTGAAKTPTNRPDTAARELMPGPAEKSPRIVVVIWVALPGLTPYSRRFEAVSCRLAPTTLGYDAG